MQLKLHYAALLLCWLAPSAVSARAGDDLLMADFEGPDYGGWTRTGEAFGDRPAQGTLPDQMPVSGFEGHGLANSFLRGDATTGVLSSPEFRLERPYLNFLIGGGHHPGETCINLLVDGKTVRSETGSDNEHLDWCTWDLRKLVGKMARIEIVDRHSSGWGHINVDQIVLSETARAEPPESAPLYAERYRPQFHFTAAKNWLNDPNGLVFYQGEYHLFFQHNPSGLAWGNMTWGHAVSADLFHWQQLDDALRPDSSGTMFSGSAVVDWKNSAGFQAGDEPALICIYTAAGGTSPESQGQPFTQAIASSNDRGRSWQKYSKNPVLGHVEGSNRDPKVFWHEAAKRWIMILFLDGEKYALFGSPDLKQWTRLSDLPAMAASECPDLFELPLSGDAATRRWIFWGGNNLYLIGSFDGASFTKESGPHRFEYGPHYYAAQSYSDIPAADGRRIQIAWMNGGSYPHMPFNQQMSLPSELVLTRQADGLRLCRRPVRELDALHAARFAWQGSLASDENPLRDVPGELVELRAEIELGQASALTFTVRGTPITYDVGSHELRLAGKAAPLAPVDGKIQVQVIVDRSSIEVFGNGGLVSLSACFLPPAGDKTLQLSGRGATVTSLQAWQLKSAWPRSEP